MALDGRNQAKGSLYIDDYNTHGYRAGQNWTATDFEFKTIAATVSVLKSQPQRGIYNAKNWIEQVEVRGMRSMPKTITVLSHYSN